MRKSVYSLVLTDDIVSEIDRLAYELNTSRSNMINQILSDYVSLPTPEKRMREVFSELERLIMGDSVLTPLLQPSDSMYSLRSALSYKYNPTLKYSVELYANAKPYFGELRVSVRSQNNTLMLTMLQFFKLWTRIENAYIGQTECCYEDGRFIRKLRCPTDDVSNERIGEAISDYIHIFDNAIKAYFENLTSPQYAMHAVEQIYAGYVRSCGVIL